MDPEFDAFAKEYGDEVAVYAMFEWYNRWIKENTIVLEGFEHLQEHKLVENIESLLKKHREKNRQVLFFQNIRYAYQQEQVFKIQAKKKVVLLEE